MQTDACENEMLSALKGANSILLCTHAAPDGDAVGSLLGMGRTLERLGKQITMCCADPVPGLFRFLWGADRVKSAAEAAGGRYDLGLALDSASLERLGDCEKAFSACPMTIQMDHHGDNPGYADLNWMDAEASAAGCLVWRMMNMLGIRPDRETAECLYCAVSTDTGNFRFQNTNAEAFSMMAELMGAGLELAKIARVVHQIREIPAARLLGRALQTLRFFAGGKGACMRLTLSDYAAAEALPEHNTGIVNYALDLPGVEMAFLSEEREGECKASLRAVSPRNVQVIAKKFGGGGHALASGMRYDGPIGEMEEALIGEMTAALAREEQ